MINKKIYYQAVLELAFAATIWGASFTFVRWGLDSFTAATLIFWRFIIAFIVGEILHYFGNKDLFQKSGKDITLAMLPGFFLGLSLFFQTYGLNFTTATNSGFITSMYVILIPLISAVFFKYKANLIQVIFGLTAFVGMGFMLKLDRLYIARGELITVLAAITAALQIIWIGKDSFKIKSAFRFNNYQSLWALVTVTPFVIFDTTQRADVSLWPSAPTTLAIVSLITLALLVSLLAFYLQVRAQKILSTSTSSMLCLLEAPFAFIFASYFLNESLNLYQLFGAFLILSSSFFSIVYDRPKNR